MGVTIDSYIYNEKLPDIKGQLIPREAINRDDLEDGYYTQGFSVDFFYDVLSPLGLINEDQDLIVLKMPLVLSMLDELKPRLAKLYAESLDLEDDSLIYENHDAIEGLWEARRFLLGCRKELNAGNDLMILEICG